MIDAVISAAADSSTASCTAVVTTLYHDLSVEPFEPSASIEFRKVSRQIILNYCSVVIIVVIVVVIYIVNDL